MKLSQGYLDNRFQRVLLVDQSSEWEAVRAGVLQIQLLGLLFLWFILLVFVVIYLILLNLNFLLMVPLFFL